MIYRAILLELSGGSTELELEARVLHAAGPRGSELTWESFELGGLLLQEDGWHTVGAGGAVGFVAHHTPDTAIQSIIKARALELARRLAP